MATSNKSSKTSTNHRGSTRSYGGRANSNKRNASGGGVGGGGSTNPVNRLIDDQHRHSRQLSGSGGGVVERNGMDSSTSNDETRNAAMIAAEKAYGQINPGFQSSRPNSLVYSVTGLATDSFFLFLFALGKKFINLPGGQNNDFSLGRKLFSSIPQSITLSSCSWTFYVVLELSCLGRDAPLLHRVSLFL